MKKSSKIFLAGTIIIIFTILCLLLSRLDGRIAIVASGMSTPTGTATSAAISDAAFPTTMPTAIVEVPGSQAAQARTFAEPIMQAISDKAPDFEDDFSTGGPGWTWDERMAGQVEIADGVMRVDGTGGHGVFPPNNQLNGRNFVYEFDVRLLDPQATLGTFFRQQNADAWYGFMIHGNDNSWHMNISVEAQPPTAMGFDNVRPQGELNRITMVARGNRFAVYLNGKPTAYFEDTTFPDAGNLVPTFKSETGEPVQGEFDNFKFWNLDTVSELSEIIEPGDVLFEEDFEDGEAETFNYLSQNWQVLADETGNMVLEGNNTPGHDEALGAGFGAPDWTDYAVTYRLRILNSNGDAWLNFRNTTSWYVQRFSVHYQHLGLYYAPMGAWEPLREPNYPAQRNVWYQVRVEAQGEMIRIYINDQLVIEQADALVMPGNLAIGGLADSHLQFDDIRVIALAPGAALNPQAAQARAFAEPILQTIARRTPDFEDDFSTDSQGWQIDSLCGQIAGGRLRTSIIPEQMAVQSDGNYTCGAHNPGVLNATNFVFEIDLTQTQAEVQGLAGVQWRHTDGYYRVSVDMPGTYWTLARSSTSSPGGAGVEILQEWEGPSSGLIRVIGRGSQFAVYIDEKPVFYLVDDLNPSGEIDLWLNAPDGSVTVEYDNVKFWNLDNVPGLP